VLSSLRTLAFRLPPDMADQLNQVAARHGRTLGSLIRESLTVHLNLKGINLMEGTMASPPPLPASPPAVPERPPERLPERPPERLPDRLPERLPDRPPLLGRKATDPEMPVVTRGAVGTGVGSHPTPPGGIPMSALPADLRMTQPMPMPPQVIAGPGAIKAAQPPHPPPSVLVDKSAIVTEEASPDEAASAVSLGGPKKKQNTDEDTIERGWFGR
jgi:hypothetical protein